MTTRAIRLALLAAVLWGCPDPDERFEEFVERTEPFRRPPADLGSSSLEGLDGRFLLSAAVVELGGGVAQPLVFDVQVETNYQGRSACPPEGCTLNLRILPLVSPPSGCPDPFSPVAIAEGSQVPTEGEPQPVEVRDIPVRSDGSFVAQLPQLAIGGCANPFTGRVIVARLNLEAVTKSPDRFCGFVRGEVLEPIRHLRLSRSTFSAERIDDDPRDLDPAPIVVACPTDPQD